MPAIVVTGSTMAGDDNEAQSKMRDLLFGRSSTMRKTLFSIVLLASTVVHFEAHAAIECNVSVRRVLLYADGTVNVWHSGREDYTVVCNLQSTYGSVSPSTCTMWTAMLQVIKKKNGIANFYYPGTGTCATLPTYGGAPIPGYIGDVTP